MTLEAATWRGQAGAVLLGPTEDRVARYLEDATRHGRVTLRTAAIADRLGLARSEAYRILRTLRTLGLFGIEDDRSGARGGRRIWRTRGRRAGVALDAGRHRAAWARIAAWMRSRAGRIAAQIRAMTTGRPRQPIGTRPLWADPAEDAPAGTCPPVGADPPSDEPTLAERALRRWAPELADKWDRATRPGDRPSRWRPRP